MVVRLANVSFNYRLGEILVPVLRDVSLTIRAGDMVAIKGSSGSGKSTLLYILGCLLRPDSGRVVLDGHELSRLTSDELAEVRNRTIGFVFQQFHLLPRATVVDNILMPVHYPVETTRSSQELEGLEKRAIQIARELGLGEHLHHLPNQLSGGQQQRVAIARALMNDAKIILADEPTGNLDSKNAALILELLKDLNKRGKTVIIVTHDNEVARHCSRVCEFKDGAFVGEHEGVDSAAALGQKRGAAQAAGSARAPGTHQAAQSAKFGKRSRLELAKAYVKTARVLIPLAWQNLQRNKARSALTMLGVVIGIAAVLSMVTVGSFAQQKILESYEELGVNRMSFRGWNNWQLKAADKVPLRFQKFDFKRDILPIVRVFKEVQLLSPVLNAWNTTVNFGGRSISTGTRVLGVNPEYMAISNRQLSQGHGFSPYQMDTRSAVCVIGSEIEQQLFDGISPIGQVMYVTTGDTNAYGCRVIGVMRSQNSNSEWNKPNLQVLIPFTYFQSVVENWWEAEIHELAMQMRTGVDVERAGQGIKAYFQLKYGKSGRFDVGSDAILIAQMKRFLNIFTLLLASISLISLVVGGIGITNMMLVSVAERFKEIGLRKALGATDFSIRVQFLLEALILCLVAGLIGMGIGFTVYELLIYGASKFIPKLHFEWVVEPGAVALSVVSIVAVGVASGLVPALRAEKLEVIEALRSE